jgi:hypothetical protein
MSRPPAGQVPAEPPARYELHVGGVLDGRWSAWFEGLPVTSDASGKTVIAGPVTHQAALHGLLAKVRDLVCPCCRSAASTQTGDQHWRYAPTVRGAVPHPPAPRRPGTTRRRILMRNLFGLVGEAARGDHHLAGAQELVEGLLDLSDRYRSALR